ncbi:MAG: hypothetical protein U0Q15_20015 [Kineosporiaceae bacterium]
MIPGRNVGMLPLVLGWWLAGFVGSLVAMAFWPPPGGDDGQFSPGFALIGLVVFLVLVTAPLLGCAALVIQVRRWCAAAMPPWAAAGVATLAAVSATLGLATLAFGTDDQRNPRILLLFGLPTLVPMLVPLVGDHRARRRGFRLAWVGSSREPVVEPAWPPLPAR